MSAKKLELLIFHSIRTHIYHIKFKVSVLFRRIWPTVSRPGQASSKVRGGISYFLCLLKKNSLKLSCNKTKAPYRHEPIYFPCHHFAAYFWPCTLGTGVKIGRGFFCIGT